jgi:hypothetical protein
MVTGKRTKKNTIKLIKDFANRTNYLLPKLITSDEYKTYADALLVVYGEIKEIPAKIGRGRKPHPKKEIPRGLVYAIVRKYRQKGKVIDIKIKLKYGTQEQLDNILFESSVSKHVNTSFIERYNSTDRQMSARKRRMSYTFSKKLDYHKSVSWFIISYYNFCRYNTGLSSNLNSDNVNVKSKYKNYTPAMKAEIVNHKLSIWELLNLKV